MVSVGGGFHAFHLSRELERQDALLRLFTSYPASHAIRRGVSKDRVTSLMLKEILQRGWGMLPSALKGFGDPRPWLHNLYDLQVARRMPQADIFVGWSSFALQSIRRAKALGMKSLVDHGSSHIEFQRDILTEEAKRTGVCLGMPHPLIVEKEIREYHEADYIVIPSTYARNTFIEKGVPEEKLIQIPY